MKKLLLVGIILVSAGCCFADDYVVTADTNTPENVLITEIRTQGTQTVINGPISFNKGKLLIALQEQQDFLDNMSQLIQKHKDSVNAVDVNP